MGATLLLLATVFFGGVAGAAVPPVIDGLVDPEYAQLYDDANATVYYYADSATLYFAVVNKPNENVFGARSYHDTYQTGWNNHNFKHLLNSDHLDVELRCGDASGTVSIDYLYDDGGTWRAGPAGPDGLAPSSSLISGLVASSSLVWDLQNQSVHSWDYTLGGLPKDDWQSPTFNPLYPTLTGSFANWELRNIYEFSVDSAPWQSCSPVVAFPEVHNSPPKWGEIGYPVPPQPLPESTPTPTNTAVPPTATDTPTATAVPPTATSTATATGEPATATATPTGVPPTATATATGVPATATSTPAATTPAVDNTATPTATTAPAVVETETPVPTTGPAEATSTPEPTVASAQITATSTPVVATAVVTVTPVVEAVAVSLPKAGEPVSWLLSMVVGVCLMVSGIALRRIGRRSPGTPQ